MTNRESTNLHDLWGGVPAVPAAAVSLMAEPFALPTPTTPGYTYFTDYLGHRWTCCVCMKEYLTFLQMRWLQLGWIKSGLDVWQLTGGATDSAGTHSQGGAGDLLYQTEDKHVLYLRDHGATAAWRRTTAQGFTKVHVHFVLRGCIHNTPARYQVVEEQNGPPSGTSGLGYHGGDGLVGTAFDYHRDPRPYMNWDAGVTLMKKELGLMALATTTTIALGGQPMSKGSYVMTTATTSQSGATYAAGTHVYDFLPVGSTTWQEFHRAAVVNGKSSFLWNYGSNAPIRARFIPKDATVSAASSSVKVAPQVIDIAVLQQQVADLTVKVNGLIAENTDLKAKLAAAGGGTPNPPKPVPAYGIDVSGNQTVEQVRALMADTATQFVIVKATEGVGFTNKLYGSMRDLAGDRFVGAYGYTSTGNKAVDEANHFLSVVGNDGHYLAVDVETAMSGPWVIEWCDTVAAARPDAVVGVYTNWLWMKDDPGTGRVGIRNSCSVAQWDYLVTRYPLWLAEVATAGKFSSVSPRAGSTKGWPVNIHQYAYTHDSTGQEIDRDWTPDFAKLKG